MTLFDFIRKTPKAEPIPDRARDLLVRLVADLKTASWHWNAKPAEIAICEEIMAADPADQVVLLPLIAEEALELLEGKTRWSSAHLVKGLLSQMLRRKLPLKEQDLIRLAELTGTLRSHWYFDSIVPIAPLLGVIEEHIDSGALSAALSSALKEMHRRVAPYVSVTENRRAASRIETLLARPRRSVGRCSSFRLPRTARRRKGRVARSLRFRQTIGPEQAVEEMAEGSPRARGADRKRSLCRDDAAMAAAVRSSQESRLRQQAAWHLPWVFQ